MRSGGNQTTIRGSAREQFQSTHWSVVLKARQSSTPSADEALARLCRDYWYPIYAYVRRRGHSSEDAQDLTQAFFAQFLEKNGLRQADRQRGKFRCFLLGSLRHFLANEWHRRHTVRRGGRCLFVSWEELNAENRYRQEPFHNMNAEKLYERRWALTVLDKTIAALKNEFASAGQAELFEALQEYLTAPSPEDRYCDIAPRLGLTEAALKMRIHRFRRRFGQLLRAEVSQTVRGPKELEEELQNLFVTWD